MNARWYTATNLLPAAKEKHKLEVKIFYENEPQVGMGLENVRKQCRDESQEDYPATEIS